MDVLIYHMQCTIVLQMILLAQYKNRGLVFKVNRAKSDMCMMQNVVLGSAS
jgi:hypothetical protein